MTPFLSRLVDRARGTASRVKPVLASPFAPAPATEVETYGELHETQAHLTAAKSASTTPTEFRSEVEQRETQDGDALSSKETKRAPGLQKAIADTPPPPLAKPVETAVEILRESLLVPQVQQDVDDSLVRHSPLEPKANGQHARVTPIDKISTRERQPGWATQRLSHAQQPSRLSQKAENRRAPEGARDQAPIVRVTIGRVEVRAIHPPAPAPKPARPAAPKLSLDEYLRGRKR